MNRIVHFDIMADRPERAEKFYKNVFGWKFEKWQGGSMDYWMITTGKKEDPGINGGMGMRDKNDKGQARFMNTIQVASVDEYMKKILQNGGKTLMPKMAIPGVGWFATAEDTEGNQFGIMQEDKSAE